MIPIYEQNGNTGLTLAAVNGHKAIVILLCEKGANPFLKDYVLFSLPFL